MKQILCKNPFRIISVFLAGIVCLIPIMACVGLSNLRINSSKIAEIDSSLQKHDSETASTPGSDSSTPSLDKTETDPEKPTPTPEIKDEPVYPPLWIKAINPGYTVDKVREVGELIELARNTSTTDSLISLAGYSLRYTNASGKSTILYEFPDGSSMAGENLLMRLTRSPESELSDVTYSTTLAMSAGPLELLYQGKVVDSVCWTGKGDCAPAFKAKTPTTLLREKVAGEFVHVPQYEPQFDLDHKSIIFPISSSPATPDEVENKNQPTQSEPPHCKGLEFSEIYAYYTKEKSEQFIEIYNSSDMEIVLDGCSLKYKKKDYALSGRLAPSQYYAYYPNGKFSLTKNPSSSNIIEIYDIDGSRVDIAEYYHGQKKSTAYARFFDAQGEENWNSTYHPTPNAENIYQEFRSCPAGKVINPETGNCVKSTSATPTVKECPPGKYRSPVTNRCRNIESDKKTQKPCAEGYERNPETNRCRKIKQPNEGADYALVPATRSDDKTFVAFGLVIGLVGIGILYIIFQFRREIIRAIRKIRQGLHHILKNLVSRRFGFHRNKKS